MDLEKNYPICHEEIQLEISAIYPFRRNHLNLNILLDFLQKYHYVFDFVSCI